MKQGCSYVVLVAGLTAFGVGLTLGGVQGALVIHSTLVNWGLAAYFLILGAVLVVAAALVS
mgnify:CR=1 FL=1